MSYQEFIKTVLKELKERMSEGTELRVQSIIKNNNLHLDGLSIMQEGSNISPTFYLNYYYDDFVEHKDMERIIRMILKSYENHPQLPNLDVDFFTNLDKARNNIVYKIVNFSMNKELLKDVPHIPYLDLAIVFYYLMNNERFPNATILIRNQHLAYWNISDKQLYDIAIENTPRLLPHKLMNMKDLISEFEELQLPDLPDEDKDCFAHAPAMYVLTNTAKVFGASCILYLDLLWEISNYFHSSLYVLPSSIHEVILVPCNDKTQFHIYSEMVQEVNSTHVLDEDILSDHAYFYDREQKALLYF